MNETSAFPPSVVANLALIGTAYVACTFAPVLYSAYIALRRRPAIPRRLLFVGAVTALSYGALCFLSIAIDLPLSAYLIYIAPQLEASGHTDAASVAFVGRVVATYWWVGFVPVLAIASVLITNYLARRWAPIVEALDSH